MSILKKALSSFCGIFSSRISGLFRDAVFAWYWGGTGVAQAAFTLAFRIPNMFRSLLGEGALNSALIPSISGLLAQGRTEDAWALARRVISLMLLVLGGLVVLLMLGSVAFSAWMPQGISPHVALGTKITPLLLPYLLLICETTVFLSVLNCIGKFFLPSAIQMVFNVVEIGGMVLLHFLWPDNSTPHALYFFCGVVLLGGILQLGLAAWFCSRKGFSFRLQGGWGDPEVRSVCRKFFSASLGAGVHQVNVWIDMFFLGMLAPVGIAALTNSNRLVYMPVGLFGVAVGMVCLPALSAALKLKDTQNAVAIFDEGVRLVLFLCLPCVALLGVLAEPVVRMLFQHGAYTAEATAECVRTIHCALAGIPAFCLVKVVAPLHHADNDTKTPARIGMLCVALNLVLNCLLVKSLQQCGLMLATCASSWLNLILLLWTGRRHLSGWSVWRTFGGAMRLAAAALIAGGTAWLLRSWMPDTAAGTFAHLLRILLWGGGGLAVYLVFCLGLKSPELRAILKMRKA